MIRQSCRYRRCSLLPQGLHALKQVAHEVGLDLKSASVNLDGGFEAAPKRKCMWLPCKFSAIYIHRGAPVGHDSSGFLPTFGDVTFWNIVSSFVVISNASIYPFVTDLMLVVNVTGVSPETALP
jgi:hypothetical protein